MRKVKTMAREIKKLSSSADNWAIIITCPNCDHQFAWGDAQVSEEQRAIYELYQHGHSIRAIGRMFKMHPESVRYRIKELNRNKYVEPNPVQEKREAEYKKEK